MRVFDVLILCTDDQVVYIVEEGTDKILDTRSGISRLNGFYNACKVKKLRSKGEELLVYV